MEIYLASGNPHKLGEFAELFYELEFPVNLVSAVALGGMPEVEENGETFAENARIKAHALLGKVPSRTWLLADDSGLCVDALGGAPGVRSARFAGAEATAEANNAKLLKELAGVAPERRTARFFCVLLLLRKQETDYSEKAFTEDCEGEILTNPRSGAGFGYDPLFVPRGEERSFAEMAGARKNEISHRGRAMTQLVRFLQNQCDSS